ncbi:MAG: transketolase [Firmicutes bacterium]|nr:transketolase [Bacillota bacterium]
MSSKNIAKEIRREIVKMTAAAKSGHPGGSLSLAEIMEVLYFEEMKIDPAQPDWPERDRFVLSKGHATPVLYSTLALRGFFPKEELKNFRQIDSILQGHPDMKGIPGVDFSTGSLGQGLSGAVGMALAARLDKNNSRVYAVIGDGECQEGQIWEAAMAAAHYKLANLTVILDYNNLQICGKVDEVMDIGPIAEKWQAFGWRVIETDGHDLDTIRQAIKMAQAEESCPTIIIAHTIKGKGVSFMENDPDWHGRAPNQEQLALALAELEKGE